MSADRFTGATSEQPPSDVSTSHGRTVPLARFAKDISRKSSWDDSTSRETPENESEKKWGGDTTVRSISSEEVEFESRSTEIPEKSQKSQKPTSTKTQGKDGEALATENPPILQAMKHRRDLICLIVAWLFCCVFAVIFIGMVAFFMMNKSSSESNAIITAETSNSIAASTFPLMLPVFSSSRVSLTSSKQTTRSKQTTSTSGTTKELEEEIREAFPGKVFYAGGDDPNAEFTLNTTWQIPTENYRPLSYGLQLYVRLPGYETKFPEDWGFYGRVAIYLTVDSHAEDVLELHSNHLDIQIAVLTPYISGNETPSMDMARRMSIVYNKTIERVGFSDGKSIEPGNYVLELVYNGTISKDMTGLYRSMYYDKKSRQKRFIATTQMEPTYARQMVPCFDEPRFKAKWTFQIYHPVGTTATSNMPIDQHQQGALQGLLWEQTKFEETPVMSSYILALVVHAWSPLSETIKANNVTINVYARPDKIDLTKFALEVAVRVLQDFEEMIQIKYPLRKLDLFAIPDFSAGAMENWGLMTFREDALLYDPKHSSRKAYIQLIITHEIAHQWFGNLVTMNWWNELWLNEGFATFMELFGRLPNMAMEDAIMEFVLFQRLAMINDALYPGEPMVRNLDQNFPEGPYNKYPRTPVEIRHMFDQRAYSKGGLGLYAVFATLGPDRFFSDIKAYLNKHQYSTSHSGDVLAGDLFRGDQAWSNTKKALNDHLQNAGLPMLKVTRKGTPTVYSITQERFYLSKNYTEMEFDLPSNEWTIPVTAKTEKIEKLKYLIPTRKEEKEAGNPIKLRLDLPPILNFDGRAYARVCYGKNWRLVLQTMEHVELKPLTRALIYEDLFAMAEAGNVDYLTALDFAFWRLEHGLETNKNVRNMLIAHVNGVFDRFHDASNDNVSQVIQSVRGAFEKMVNPIKKPGGKLSFVAHKEGTYHERLEEILAMKASETEYHLIKTHEKMFDTSLRLGTLKNDDNEIRRHFIENVKKPCADDTELSQCVTISSGRRDKDYRNFAINLAEGPKLMYDKLKIETDIQEAETLACSLVQSSEWEYPKKIFNDIIDGFNSPDQPLVRLQSVGRVMKRCLTGQQDKARIIDFLLNNGFRIYEGLKTSWSEMEEVYEGLVKAISSKEDIAKVKMLLKELPREVAKLPLWETTFEAFRVRHAWDQQIKPQILDYFKRKMEGENNSFLDEN